MKIVLVCNMGGHLSEMLFLMEAFENHDVIFFTYEDPRIKQLKYKKYLMENIGTNIWKMLKMFFKTFKILRKERPDLIVSTGSEIAIPSFILARIMSIKTIYIESWCRVKTKRYSVSANLNNVQRKSGACNKLKARVLSLCKNF